MTAPAEPGHDDVVWPCPVCRSAPRVRKCTSWEASRACARPHMATVAAASSQQQWAWAFESPLNWLCMCESLLCLHAYACVSACARGRVCCICTCVCAPVCVHARPGVSQKSEKFINLVLEYCAGGDLSKYIQTHGPFPEKVCRHFMRQLGGWHQRCRVLSLQHPWHAQRDEGCLVLPRGGCKPSPSLTCPRRLLMR
jgi:hypothetical protein